VASRSKLARSSSSPHHPSLPDSIEATTECNLTNGIANQQRLARPTRVRDLQVREMAVPLDQLRTEHDDPRPEGSLGPTSHPPSYGYPRRATRARRSEPGLTGRPSKPSPMTH
jgi:hypothetical protein